MCEAQYIVFLFSFHLPNAELKNGTLFAVFVYKAQSTKEVATFMAVFSYEALSLKKADICKNYKKFFFFYSE